MNTSNKRKTPECCISIGGKKYRKGLLGLTVSTFVNKIPRAHIEFNLRQFLPEEIKEEGFSITPAATFTQEQESKLSFDPGTPVSIKLGYENNLQEVFSGVLVKQEIKATNNGAITLMLTCKHPAYNMTLGKNTRFLHQEAGTATSGTLEKTPLDEALIALVNNGNYGLQLETPGSQREIARENLIKYNCSDWDFLIMNTEATNRVCIAKNKNLVLQTVKVQDQPQHTFTLGNNILSYNSTSEAGKSYLSVNATHWDTAEQKVLENSVNGTADHKEVKEETWLNFQGNLTDAESRAFAEGIQSRSTFSANQSKTRVKGDNTINLLDTIKIAGFHASLDHLTVVSGIVHVLEGSSWHTFVHGGLPEQSHAEKYTLGKNSYTTHTEGSELLYGKVTGITESEDGHELYAVNVALKNAQTDNHILYARHLQTSAGSHGGTVFRPGKDSEVVVGFMGGDPSLPVILGVLYNQVDKPAYPAGKEGTEEAGISWKDWQVHINTEEEKLHITSPNSLTFTLDDRNKEVLMAYDEQNKISITGEGIELKATAISLKGSKEISLEGASINGKAKTEMKLESSTSLTLEGKVLASLKGQLTQIN